MYSLLDGVLLGKTGCNYTLIIVLHYEPHCTIKKFKIRFTIILLSGN